jgi:hypothetical protein
LGIDWNFVYGGRGNIYSFCFNRFTPDLKGKPNRIFQSYSDRPSCTLKLFKEDRVFNV